MQVAVALGIAATVLDPWSAQFVLAVRTDGGGRYYNNFDDLDGVSASFRFSNMTPRSGMCQLMATSYENYYRTLQNEVGVLSCNQASGAGATCSGGPKRYFESAIAGAYSCSEKGTANANTNYNFSTYRTGTRPSDGSEVMSSYIDGVFVGSVGGYVPSTGGYAHQIWYGPEVAYNAPTGGSFPCDSSWSVAGSWSSVQYRQRSTATWKSVTSSTLDTKYCLGFSGFTSSGAFNAGH